MKFIVLSSEIKDLVKNVRIEIGRSWGSIFHEFTIALEGLGLSLSVPLASCLEAGFREDFEEGPDGKPLLPEVVIPGSGAY